MISVSIASKEDAGVVLLDPELYDRTSNDNSPPAESIDIPDLLYIGGYVNDQIASLLIPHEGDHGTKVHFQCLRKYRKYAHNLCELSMEMITPFLPVYAEIPGCYKGVINFSKKHGFREIAVNPKCYPKGGILHDRHIMVYP